MDYYLDDIGFTLGDQIELLKVLAEKFRDTGDFVFISEILMLVDDIESPDLLTYLDFQLKVFHIPFYYHKKLLYQIHLSS